MIDTLPDVTTGLINSLIESCAQCRRSLSDAAQAVADPCLSRELALFCQQQEQFAQELAARLTMYGDAPAPHDSASSRSAGSPLDGGDRLSILLACEQSSASMVAAFRRALGQDIAPQFSGVIEAQYEAIQEAHERIKVLRSWAATDEVH